MTELLVVLPLVLPVAGAAASLGLAKTRQAQAVVTTGIAASQFGLAVALLSHVWEAGPLVVHVGGWPPGTAIALVADAASATVLALTSLVATLVLPFAETTVDRRRAVFGFFPVTNVLFLGVAGILLTGDLFNLYVWFEVTLIASFVLMGLGGGRLQMEGAMKYVALNLVASALFLTGVGLIYGSTGTVSLGSLGAIVRGMEPPWLLGPAATLVMAAFLVKAAAFPFFAWLPASYHTPPVAVTALFAGLLTKVGVYALLRLSSLVLSAGETASFVQPALLTIGGLTMVTGVLGAAAHYDVRRILSFHIVSQIGYMVMGAGFLSASGYTATLYFMGHNMFAKTGLFLVAGIAYRLAHHYDVRALGGLMRRHPGLTAAFAVCAASLAGFPPFAGFFGKLALAQVGLANGHGAVVGVALATGLLTLYSMTKIWHEAFWKPMPPPEHPSHVSPWAWASLTGFALLSIGAGLAAGPLFALLDGAGEALADPAAFIQAATGGAR